MSDQILNPAGPLAKRQLAINLFNQGINRAIEQQIAGIQCLAAISQKERKVAVISPQGNIRLIGLPAERVALRMPAVAGKSDI